MRFKLFAIMLLTLIFIINESNATSFKVAWEVEGFANPESVLVTKNHPWLYVSNVNGENKGFISRLNKQGKLDKLKWVDGLINPTGMGMLGDNLYVVDYKFVRVIDTKTGEIIQNITAESVAMLNDLTVGKNGRIFVSDILGGKIFEVAQNKLVVWLENEKLPHPNGLLLEDNTLVAVNLGSKLSQNPTPAEYGSAFKIDLKTKEVQMIRSSYKLGGLDGLVPFKGSYIISHFPAGEVYQINEKERILIDSVDVSSADIAIDEDSEMLFIPFLFKNKVSAYKLSHAE